MPYVTTIYLVWKQNYDDNGKTIKSTSRTTFDEDTAKEYCNTKNEEQSKLFGDSIYKTHYFYSAEEILTSYSPAL